MRLHNCYFGTFCIIGIFLPLRPRMQKAKALAQNGCPVQWHDLYLRPQEIWVSENHRVLVGWYFLIFCGDCKTPVDFNFGVSSIISCKSSIFTNTGFSGLINDSKASRRIGNRPRATSILHPRILLKCCALQCFMWCESPFLCVITMWSAFFTAFYNEICLNWVFDMELQKRPFRCGFVLQDHDISHLGHLGQFYPSCFHTGIACLTNFPSPLPRVGVCPQAGIYQLFSCSATPHQLYLYAPAGFHGSGGRF